VIANATPRQEEDRSAAVPELEASMLLCSPLSQEKERKLETFGGRCHLPLVDPVVFGGVGEED
jgi:hypothetical protein